MFKYSEIHLNRFSIKKSFVTVAAFFCVSMLISGCAKSDDGIEVTEDTLTTIESEAVEEVDVKIDEVVEMEEVDVIPVITEVVYDFDTYDEVASPPSESFSGDEPIRAIYVSAYAAASEGWIDSLIDIADTTELNAFVIDVKNDYGHITFDVDLEEADEINADRNIITDIDALMDKLYDHDIFPIARIVTFKDPYLAENKQEYVIRNQDGSPWYHNGVEWLNPYNRDTWKYIVDVAKEAAKVGFKEIQFDYIRFADSNKLYDADFGGLDTVSREEIIVEFVDYAMEELKPYGVDVSADVYGIIISSEVDAKVIGQDYIEMSKRLDVICPMVYPSHYGYGFFGIPAGQHSDKYPYMTIYGSMEDSNEELAIIPEGDHVAVVRPWLQAFTASYIGSGNYIVYGKEAIRAQIDGAYDAGLTEWILWNAGVKYNSSSFLPKEVIEEVEQ